ncbi:hypothetical protein AB1Y20_014517 [Prymnesium parvum]|uniref:Transmembrane protein 50A n=1 Tax=Prymnesium parvum TaxID=97485 RepID=A0AB34IEK7_PRYPA
MGLVDFLVEGLPSIGSTVAGVLFGVSWLLWIDGVVFANSEFHRGVDGTYWIPGILQTISLAMINVIPWEAVAGDSAFDDGEGIGPRIWVFASFVFAFGGLIGAVWILVQEINAPSWEQGSVDPALKGLLQNIFIFAASLIFRLCRLKSDT